MTNHKAVQDYYRTLESVLGYRLFLGGTRHFGFYGSGQFSRPWNWHVAQIAMERQLIDRLDLPRGSKVLDAGCGEGNVAARVSALTGLRISGIDLLEESIRRARIRHSSNLLSFELGTFDAIPHEAETFDAVYTLETLVHASDPSIALQELHRVLRPGGRAVLFEYSSSPEAELAPEAWSALNSICNAAGMPSWLTLNHGKLESIAEEIGFEVSASKSLKRNMLPMLKSFRNLAVLPYMFLRRVKNETSIVNMMSAVEMTRYQEAWDYRAYVLIKSR